jgi:tetratricopeptide (TPR) repeat protein
MEKLIRLIQCLKPGAVQWVEDFYKARCNGDATDNKRLQLFRLLAEGKVHTNEEAARLLYHQKCNSALSHLKKRLEEDILNFLLFDLDDCEVSTVTKEELKCNKLLLQGKMLIAKGIWEDGISLLKKTSRISEKFEFPDIKLASDDILRTYSSEKLEVNHYQRYNEHIDKCLGNYRKLLKAKELSLRFSHETDRKENLPSTFFSKLNDDKKNIPSKKVIYWNKMALLQFYQKKRDFATAKKYAFELLEYLQMEPQVCSDFKAAHVNLELAKILIYLKDYKNALSYAEQAICLLPYTSIDYLQGLRVLYFANFRCGNIAEAETAVASALKHPETDATLKGKWLMLSAALEFVQRKFCVVNRILYTNKAEKNDPVWEVGGKILEMLTILESEDYDWFEFKIESFRKKVQSFRDGSHERLKIFYSILKTLVKTNYDYKETLSSEKQNLELLACDKPLLYWDPMGYELIHTGGWLLNKARSDSHSSFLL